jgi:hypothetical protein
MGLFDWLGSDPSKAANKYLDQIPGMAHKAFDPYINMGQQMGKGLQDQYSQLMNDPGARMNQIGAGYQQSPGFQFALKQAMQAGGNAAAAGGMAGSPMHEFENMNTATGMANQDYNQYLQNAMGMYNTGLSGASGMYNTGANASNSMANMMNQNMQNQASNAYSGANWRNSMNIGLPLQAAAAYYTGGASLAPGMAGGNGGQQFPKYLGY